jgi:kynurenine formamidase
MCLPGTVEVVREQAEQDGRRIDRRTVLAGGAAAAVAAAFPMRALAHGRPKKKRVRDLTHVFTAGFPVYTFDPPSKRTLVTIPSGGFYAQEWTFGEHSGTHMDAPGHFVAGGRLSPDITPEGALVAMDSGWASKVDDPLEFKGGATPADYHFPGFGLDAAMWLAERRNVTAIGVDTLSLDPGDSTTFPVHVNYLATDRYGLENLANLDRIPPHGATTYVGLIPWDEGSGGPCRVIATW